MFKSPLSDHFYTGDESFVAHANSTLENYATPLKKLATESANDAKNSVQQDHAPDLLLKQLSARADRYKLSEDRLLLTPLSDMAFLLNKERVMKDEVALFSESSKSAANDAIFYKPPSTEARLLGDFLPPALPQRGRNPILLPPVQAKSIVDDDLSSDEELVAAPTGEWTSPVVKEALRRQVNKEVQFKIVWRNILYFAAFHLFLLLAQYFFRLYQVAYYDENKVYRAASWTQLHFGAVLERLTAFVASSYHHAYHFQWVFVINVFIGAVRLCWPQDQCKDLPLTNKQRRLIGLKAEDDETDADFVVKLRLFAQESAQQLQVPKYPKINELAGSITLVRAQREEDAIALSHVIPKRRLVH